MSSPIRAPRGVKDIIPPDAIRFEKIIQESEEILAMGGFQKILLPLFESAALFSRSIGGATDIVEKEMYAFEDKGGDLFALRPEGTASLLRAAIEHRLADPGKIVRLSYGGPMFRHERPQSGRLRQFHQIGAEILGPLTPSDDVDLISLIHRMALAFSIPSWRLLLNNMGCPACRPSYRTALVSFLVQHEQELCATCRYRTGVNPLRVLDCKTPSCQSILETAPRITDFLCSKSLSHFEQVRALLDSLDIPYTLSHKLVRGLDYYTETTFEFVSDALGAQSTWAAGGRYDGLCQELGGPNIPGVGFAAGIERLWLLREKAGTLPVMASPPVWLTVFPLVAEARPSALRLIQNLRGSSIPSTGFFGAGKIKAAFRQAERDGSRFLAFIGEDEISAGTVLVKNLETGEQTSYPIKEWSRIAIDIRKTFLPA
ncbi:MAG: histidine--tRNA ligase [Leptospirales bacterium]